ncbi:DJ-1/PfpI family protein [Hydrogenophaga electricum]|uniref:Thiazole biosynthesis protein ThiJ n=1 Tax=Hydrogenophaga electricum TaxID=1230953 RepID=A0ABQ6C9T2_9BURK|nr:DJ-1/PfpI family protein [Hydrogenophaga electricum]GLS16710.1 thiazole biosynthesis protein ThiJ [Hydrogenophaga electricum]
MSTVERRGFLRAAAAALAASPWLAHGAEAPPGQAPAPHDMSHLPASWTGQEQIGMLLYPGMTALDFVGPQHMFAGLMGATVHQVAKTLAPVESDTQLVFSPTVTLDQCPRDLDILFVPGGGAGTVAAMQDAQTLAFLAERGSRAKLVSSVCTGSLLLGAAGLLRGYQATTHWATHALLADVGATPVHARVVHDRNRITGAGVSAGLDLGLAIVAMLRDTAYAQTMQLLAEYAPEPPFNAGTPHTAPPAVTAMVSDMFKDFTPQVRAALAQAQGTRPAVDR